MQQFNSNVKEFTIKEIGNEISKYKKNSLYRSKIDELAFREIYNSYCLYLNSNSIIDFDDLQIEGYKEIRNNEYLLTKLKTTYKYILVDEFQDVDDLEVNFVKLIGKDSSLFFVGDEDQCIFSFRGSKPSYTYNFKKEFQGGKIYYLSNNYRSLGNIVISSERLIKNNKNRSNKMINIVKKGGELKVIKILTAKEEASNIISIIKKSSGNIGILYRKKSDAIILALKLLNNNIGFNYYEDPLIEFKQDVKAYLNLSKNRYCKEAFKRIANKPKRYISSLSLIRLDKKDISQDIFSFLYGLNSISRKEIKTLKVMEKKLNKLNRLEENHKLNYVFEELGYGIYLKEIIGDDLMNISKNLYKKMDTNITLSTIHKAKGMEYKNLIILNCSENNFPYYKALDEEEERRIFYVAITRSVEKVYFMVRNEEGNISHFINEANSKH